MSARIAVIVVAGGSGTRMGSSLPKQFLPLGGVPVLMHTLRRFSDALADCRIVLVLPENHVAYWDRLCREHDFPVPHTVCTGGKTRFDSVRNGLACAGDVELVAVHDGVRPLVDPALIFRTVDAARKYGAAIPVVTPVDSLREVNGAASRIVDRSRYRMVQTPQVFRADLLRCAYERPCDPAFTDDASVVEAYGAPVCLCEGSYSNIKITTPVDLAVAEVLIAGDGLEEKR